MSALLLKLVNGYKTYSSAILAVVSGLGLVLAQNYSGGVTQIFQALLCSSAERRLSACVMPLPSSTPRSRPRAPGQGSPLSCVTRKPPSRFASPCSDPAVFPQNG